MAKKHHSAALLAPRIPLTKVESVSIRIESVKTTSV